MKESSKKHFGLQLLNDELEIQLKGHLVEVEETLKIEGLSVTLFNVVMELISNAVKANLKRVYFKKFGFKLDDPASYDEGLAAFTRDYKYTNSEEYRLALKDLALEVTVDIELDSDRLLILVENSSLLLEEEEKRIRTKLAKAMGARDIMDFYVHFGDETEGKGLGLAMVIILIKDLGFNPDNFRVYHKENSTVARLEFPLNKDYVPIRDRIKREQKEQDKE